MAEDDKIGLRAEIDTALIDAGVAAYTKAIGRMEDQTTSSGDAMTGSFNTVERAWDLLAGGINVGKEVITGALRRVGEIATDALGEAIAAIGDLAGAMIDGNAEFEVYETQFGVLLGSAEAAKDRLAELAQVGASTPFELPELVKGDKILQSFGLHAADTAERFGFSGEEIRLIAGDLAAGTGASFEEMATYLGKFSSGATGEVLSRFQELGIVTKEQLAQMGLEFSKSGELLTPVEDAFDVLLEVSQDKFGGMMEAQSGTFEGMLSNFEDFKAGALRTIGAPLFEVAKEGLGKVLEFLNSEGVQAGIQSLAAGLGTVAQAVADFAGRMLDGEDPVGSFANLVYTLANALGLDGTGLFNAVIGLREPFESLVAGVTDLSSAFGGFFANLAEGDLETAFEYLGESAVLQDIFKALGTDVLTVIGTIQQFGDDVQTNLPIVQGAFTDAWALIEPALAELWGVISTEVWPVIQKLIGDVNTHLPTMEDRFEVVSAAIVVAAQIFSGFLTNVVIPIIRSVVDFVVANWPTIQATIETVMAAAEEVINTVLSGIADFWNEWGDDIQEFTQGIFDAVKDIFSAFDKAFRGDWRGFGEDLRKAWDGIWQAIEKAAKDAIDAILQIDWGKLGQDIIRGIAAGLTASVQWIKDAATKAAQAALDAAKGFLGINSPSYVFQTEVGEMAGEGWANGMLDAVADVIAASRELARSAVTSGVDAFDSLTGNWLAAAPALNTGVVAPLSGATYNNTFIYQYSPTYGSAPVAPSQDFALMGVFNGI